jgi:carbon storage regulator
MRCFTRRSGQMLRIGDDVILTVTSVRGGSVRLGFNVPRDMIVDREEVAELKKRARIADNLDFTARSGAFARANKPLVKQRKALKHP